MPDREAWKLVGSEARFDFAGLLATVDLTRPDQGLGELIYQGIRLNSAALLGVQLPGQAAPPIADAYVRQRDLVVTYAETPELPFRCQIYWRAAIGPHEFPAIDLQVSVQTSLLDSHPQLWTITTLAEAETVRSVRESELTAAATAQRYDLFRLVECETSYVEIIHPADDVAGGVSLGGHETGGPGNIRRELFASFLEKGVILRARLRGVFLPRERDVELAAEAYRQFLAAPPPLTT